MTKKKESTPTPEELEAMADALLAADGKAEIVVWLAPDFWGKGIASRACKWIAEYASNQLSIKILTAKIKSGNKAAIAIAEKLGINYTNWQ